MADGESGQVPRAQPQPRRNRGSASRGPRGGRHGRGRGGADNSANSQRTQQDTAETGPQTTARNSTAPAPEQASRGRRGRGGAVGGSGNRRRGRSSSRNTAVTAAGPGTRRAFGGHLTTTAEAEDEEPGTASTPAAVSLSADALEFVPGQAVVAQRENKKSAKTQRSAEKVSRSLATDLGTRIHDDISTGSYECVICTEDVVRSSKIYSCPKCYTSLHLKCVKAWYETQIEQRSDGCWRCPGCNSVVQDVPSYHCWCGKEDDPRPSSKALPPHSCGQTCSKTRKTCPHPCTLQCHAGPCPPCDAMGPPQACFCGKHENRRPCRETDYQGGWSCQEPCEDILPCGSHTCTKPCHPGICGECDIVSDARCYCGRVKKKVACYLQADAEQSYDPNDEGWFEGTFTCDQVCARSLDCGIHKCTRTCHAQGEIPGHCPLAVDVVSHCPCGKTLLSELLDEPRRSCEDPVPHCQKPCDKVLDCGHLCKAKCHEGECPHCAEPTTVPCRCGRVTADTVCHQGHVENPLCMRVCQANLNCGRHRCGEHCCPGEKKASERQAAQRRKRGPVPQIEPEHICIRTCGKLLKCGKHSCQQMCHRGACESCPEAVFEDISCNCGRTVLQPPQPCGTQPPECRFQCPRTPRCGHPAVDHHCHPDEVECPKCPFLVDRICACGKDAVSFHPCHLQEARCGKPCGSKLECGHTCRKLCHRPGECSGATNPSKTCGQVCGKAKLLCGHPCQNHCHGKTPCNESSPCQAKVTLTCPCGQRKKEIRCQASSYNDGDDDDVVVVDSTMPPAAHPRLDCDDECLRLERNRRLAEALNIDPNSELTDHVPYSDTTLKMFRELGSWAEDKEREFRVFGATKSEVRMRFAPMPTRKRQFLHSLAEDYRLESHSEDWEAHRHVVISKTGTGFTAVPSKTLGQCIRIRDRQAAEQKAAAAAAAAAAVAKDPGDGDAAPPFNALLLTSTGFGLTVADIQAVLEPVFASQSLSLQAIEFLPTTEEVLLRVVAPYSAASGLDATLNSLRNKVADAVKAGKISTGPVVLVAVASQHDEILRRERLTTTRPDPAGWNAVAGRATAWASPSSSSSRPDGTAAGSLGDDSRTPGRKMLGLRKKTALRGGTDKTWRLLDGDVEC